MTLSARQLFAFVGFASNPTPILPLLLHRKPKTPPISPVAVAQAEKRAYGGSRQAAKSQCRKAAPRPFLPNISSISPAYVQLCLGKVQATALIPLANPLGTSPTDL